ncbi:hypothetical protein CcaverHIS002_0402900 [Cutaneotrichosporon cavernicola]|nr:hypothetical protein CcaverHIS002_0402900 [Cutaneotrichosporon cavernicola]
MVVDEKPLVDEIESDDDAKMEHDSWPHPSSPPAPPAELAMSGVDAFFVQDTPIECWRLPLAAKVTARKAFQVVVRKRLLKQGKSANRYRWRDDGLAVDWVRLPPVIEGESDDDDEIQVMDAPPRAPIPTFVLEDSPEPEPLPPPSSSSNCEMKSWSPHSPPVAKRQRVDGPLEWQSTAGGWLDANTELSRHVASSSPVISTSALSEARIESSVPPEPQQVRSSVTPEAARGSSTAPEALLDIQARMLALQEEMGARMKELQEQMKVAMQQEKSQGQQSG